MGKIKTTKRKLPNGEVWTVENYEGTYTPTIDERETIIRMGKDSKVAIIYCSDTGTKGDAGKLKKIKGIKVIEETRYGTTFELPKTEIKIGTPTRVRRTANRKTTE